MKVELYSDVGAIRYLHCWDMLATAHPTCAAEVAHKRSLWQWVEISNP